MIDNIEERLAKDEWQYLIEKYPNVAFNYKTFDGKLQSKKDGYNLIVICEAKTTMPEQWTPITLRQYDGVITWNEKFYEEHKHELNMKMIKGCLWCNSYYELDSFKSYEEKLNKVCMMSKKYFVGGRSGDIVHLRGEAVKQLSKEIEVDVWCTQRWGGERYKGTVESPIHHSHINHLRKLNEYRFSLCFDPVYHEYWSCGLVTERLFNCFKSKTVPIYFGCYNIEDFVPTSLFVDFRKFNRNYKVLADYLNSMSKDQWTDMTEAAFEWNKTNRIGSVEDLESTIREFNL